MYKSEGDPHWAMGEEGSSDAQWGTRLRLLAHSGEGDELLDEGSEDEQGDGDEGEVGTGDSQGSASTGGGPGALPAQEDCIVHAS